MPKKLIGLLTVLLVSSGCAEIVLVAFQTVQPAGSEAGHPTAAVPTMVLVTTSKGEPARGASVYAYPNGEKRLAKEISPGEYHFDDLPTGQGINFEAFLNGEVASAQFTPLKTATNTFSMQFK